MSNGQHRQARLVVACDWCKQEFALDVTIKLTNTQSKFVPEDADENPYGRLTSISARTPTEFHCCPGPTPTSTGVTIVEAIRERTF